MNVKKFKRLLADNRDVGLHFMLPGGEFVPEHFHVTEVGRVHKQFIDCGGTHREAISCVLQVWVANDKDHRLTSTKLGKVMETAGSLLTDEMPVVVEYGSDTVSQYPVGDVEITPKGLLLVLGVKPAACLAPDKCGVEGCCRGEP